VTTEAQAVDVNTLWHNHCRDAVRKFVMYAVVIDNQPVLEQGADVTSYTGESATSMDEGMGDDLAEHPAEVSEETVTDAKSSTEEGTGSKDETDAGKGNTQNNLKVRELSDAFAEQEIACAFVFPEDKVSG
jgi:hypothetical protein